MVNNTPCAQDGLDGQDGSRHKKHHCPICDKAFVAINSYKNHIRKHDPPGGFECRYCDERFCTEPSLKQHCAEQHMTIACRLCKDNAALATFNDENEYRKHIRDKHNGLDRQLLQCEKCGATYKTLEPYRRHLQTACGTIKPYKCEQCQMTFMTKYNLKHHQDSHNGERKYCCSYCGKNFTQKGRLIEHERSHTGEKPYKCDVSRKRKLTAFILYSILVSLRLSLDINGLSKCARKKERK